MASAPIHPEPVKRPLPSLGRYPATPRQRLWRVFRLAAGPHSLGELYEAAGIEPELFLSLIENWSARGHLLTLVHPLRFMMTDAARGLASPPPVKPSVPKYSGRQRLWAAMRVLKEFDLPTLRMAAEVHERSVTDFLNGLAVLGYVSLVPETPYRASHWKLIRNTGPQHPVLRLRIDGTKAVYELTDRNNGQHLRGERDIPPRHVGHDDAEGPENGGVS